MGIALALLCTAAALATTPAPGGVAPEGEALPSGPESPEGLTGANPARLIPRLELRQQLRALEGDVRVHTTTVRMDVLFLRRALLRYELPILATTSKGVQRSGLGDIEVQAITLLTSGPTQASILLVGLQLDTATRPELGTGRQVAQVGLGAAYKPVPRWLLYAVGEQRWSFAGQAARPDVSRLAVKLGSVAFGPQRDWYLLDVAPVVDFEADRAQLFGTAEAGRLLHGRIGLFLRAGTQLLGRRLLDYQLESGVRVLFGLGPA